jgi:antitoxin YefM
MDSINVDTFEKNIQDYVETVFDNHKPLKINNNGKDFIIISAEDWEREQETLYILQNNDLMTQINKSIQTHVNKQVHHPTGEEINEIIGI